VKYSRLGSTRSQLIRRAHDELRRHGLRDGARKTARATTIRARRRLLTAWRYVEWPFLHMTRPGTFVLQDREYRYFVHPHNETWNNERAVEVPIVRRAIKDAANARVLEVGNVLGHYARHDHDVVDKYEPGSNVVNVDILAFQADQPYDLIVSISTLEHVGWDDDELDPEKILQVVSHLRSMLSPGGRAIATVPLGYNPYLDELLRGRGVGFDQELCLLRVGRTAWREAQRETLGEPAYGKPFPGANGLVIGVIEHAA
jgi:hypothetical protein